MSAQALQEVRRGIIVALRADALLQSQLSGIYDLVPQQAALPYLVVDTAQSEHVPAQGVGISGCRLMLHAVSDARGRKTVLAILSRVQALLHLQSLTLTGATLLSMQVEQVEATLSGDGTLCEGALQLLCWLQEG